MRKIYLTAFLSLAFVSLLAQQKKVLADKIIATVGDKVVLRSDVENSILDMQRQNIDIPDNAKCLILEQALGIKALMLQAEKDSLPISDEEIDGEIENKIRYFINQYGSKDIVEQIAGKTIYQLKEDFKQTFREQKLAQAMRNKIVDDVKITPSEVKAYYETIPKDSLPFYESEVEVGQIVVYPKASRELETYAIDQLKEYKQQVESGAKKFETLASLYTDDKGSKETGGKYDINKNEKQWDPIFLAKAFTLKEGQVSSVFKTKFGYHIIQMISRAGDDASIRHILKIPQVSSIEVNDAKRKLDSVRSKLIAGTIKFGDAVSKFSEDDASKFTGGMIPGKDGSTFLTIDQLDKDLVLRLKDLTVGEYSQPIEYTDDREKKAVRIVQLLNKTSPHRENLKDDYNRIAQRALEEKKNDTLEKWFLKNIPTYYINIDKEYGGCTEMQKWTTNTTATN
jgi:peptidyl-prolyl cis-trans isomerase SurA